MISAVDSSVILDILTADPSHADASETLLRKASVEGKLVICECVIAELLPAFHDRSEFPQFLRDWEIDFVPCSLESSLLAGECFARYLRRGGQAKRILPDFLIAAHAMLHADRLLARDRGYFRDYFSELKLLSPG